jgi:exodeoxyribonuclease VII large subunit
MLEKPQRFIDDSLQHLDIGLRRIVDDASLTIEKLHSSLTALSPQSTLDRGYAVVQDATGHVISSANDLREDDVIGITLKSGSVTASVTQSQPNPTHS